MGKVIAALHDAMVSVAQDVDKFLNEPFMNAMFSKVDEDEDGKACPL